MSSEDDPRNPLARLPATVEALTGALAARNYFADLELATAIHLALQLGRPLLLEGEAGVGKTEVAKALARLLDAPLVRLQCYEGLDLDQAAYAWNYPRQLLHIRALEADARMTRAQTADARTAGDGLTVTKAADDTEAGDDLLTRLDLYRGDFLLRRPLLAAIEDTRRDGAPPVLLIDELDRADEEFEAFLLELLSDFQITIPELGTVRAQRPPIVVLTSNRTRDVHDAVRRRCLYCWIDYPDAEKERRIVEAKVPGLAQRVSQRAVEIVQRLRREDLFKRPGVAETLDWLRALEVLAIEEIDPEALDRTLGTLIKHRDDLERLRDGRLALLLGGT
ncbi:MAG: MoxR family ATPase [Acidobacteriota bacterium]